MAQINKPSEHFNTVTYSGNGSTQSITGVGFQPDIVWTKARSGTYGTENHFLYDAVRGATKPLIPNGTTAEQTQTTSLTSFDSDGFTSGSKTETNGASTEYVAWNWKASNATAVSNTDGTITSSVSANTTAGFSIVAYTGTGANATVGHGLGVAPQVIIWKKRSAIGTWHFWHHSVAQSGGEYQAGALNTTAAFAPFGTKNIMNGTAPTSTVFSLDTADYNDSGATYISYCFAEKKGYSKFGSYTGNGSTDGTFVYTGFLPSFVMFKSTSTTSGWEIHDNKRDTFNPSSKRLFPHLSNAEATENYVDFLSNGFKFRTTDATGNTSGATYIYMAFAEQPLVGTNNIPATGR